jgi:hypothetical protein
MITDLVCQVKVWSAIFEGSWLRIFEACTYRTPYHYRKHKALDSFANLHTDIEYSSRIWTSQQSITIVPRTS